MITSPLLRPFPIAVFGLAGVVAGIVGLTATAGVADTGPLAWIVAGLVATATIGVLARRPGVAETLAQVPRAARIAFIVGALALAVQLVWLTAFILDPTREAWTARPWRPMTSRHSCVSSYWVACTVVGRVESIYAEAPYSEPPTDPKAPRISKALGPFNVDQYEYPPPFLALPRLMTLVAPDFWGFRRLWFAINLAVVVVGAVGIGRRVDAAPGTSALWLTPFVVAAPPIISTLQAGNIQLAVIAAAMLAMLCFERRKYAAGGAMLAYVTVSKMFPGVLGLYLLLRRDWRAVTWTASFSVAIVAVTLLDLGWAPYEAFVHHMPRLLSGEAFPAFRNPSSIGVNSSVPGIPFKLALFGVPHMGFAASKIVGWAYTVVVLAATVTLARRAVPRGREPIVWLAIIMLATMRSPFLATYSGFPSLWLATLIAAVCWHDLRMRSAAIVCWCLLATTFGAGGAPPTVNAVWTFVHTIVGFVVVALAFRLTNPAAAAAEPRSVLQQPA